MPRRPAYAFTPRGERSDLHPTTEARVFLRVDGAHANHGSAGLPYSSAVPRGGSWKGCAMQSGDLRHACTTAGSGMRGACLLDHDSGVLLPREWPVQPCQVRDRALDRRRPSAAAGLATFWPLVGTDVTQAAKIVARDRNSVGRSNSPSHGSGREGYSSGTRESPDRRMPYGEVPRSLCARTTRKRRAPHGLDARRRRSCWRRSLGVERSLVRRSCTRRSDITGTLGGTSVRSSAARVVAPRSTITCRGGAAADDSCTSVTR